MKPQSPRQDLRPDPALRQAVTAAYRADETACVRELLEQLRLPASSLAQIRERARGLVMAVRERRSGASGVDNLMQEFSLSTREGVALMRLAEAMLRTGTQTWSAYYRHRLHQVFGYYACGMNEWIADS